MEIVLTFQEHTIKRRQRLASLWYPDEIVFGAIGPKLTNAFSSTTKHDYSNHFNRSLSKDENYDGFMQAVGIISSELPGLMLKPPHDFEELYDWVCSKLDNKNDPRFNPKGIGLTALYDISLVIGCNLYPKVLPRKYVYVHENLADAAQALLQCNLTDRNKVETNRFSNCLPHFSAMEIEDILCIYGKKIILKKGFDKDWLKEAIRLKVSPDLTRL